MFIILNTPSEWIYVEFEREKNTILVFLFSICLQVIQIFYDWPVKYNFLDDFGIWLLCNRIEFIWLYILHGHYFISFFVATRYEVQMICYLLILSESAPLTYFDRNVFTVICFLRFDCTWCVVYRTGVRSICVLLPILGLTWIFGVFSVNENLVVFQYIFAICNALQVRTMIFTY